MKIMYKDYDKEKSQMELDKLFKELNGYDNPGGLSRRDIAIYKKLQKIKDIKNKKK
jgi:hypothetical protein